MAARNRRGWTGPDSQAPVGSYNTARADLFAKTDDVLKKIQRPLRAGKRIGLVDAPVDADRDDLDHRLELALRLQVGPAS